MADKRLKAVATAEQYNQGNIAGLDDAMTRRLVASTVLTESHGGDLAVVNRLGYVGRYQAGAAWLVDAGYLDMEKYKAARNSMSAREWEQGGGQLRFMKDPASWKDGLSFEQYTGSPELQDKAFKINCDNAYRQAVRLGLIKEDDAPERVAGFLKARHIAGFNGARDVVSGGRVRRDENGTSNYDYYHDITRNRDGLDQHMGQVRMNQQRDPTHVNGAERSMPGVHEIQVSLSTLGYHGRTGQPLVQDGVHGPNTDHAVRQFQQMHGLKVDGIVGPQTIKALEHARQHPLVTEATHPNHALHRAIADALPRGTDPRVAANIALQAQETGIDDPSKIRTVHLNGSDVWVLGNGVDPGQRARVDLNAPTPDLQAMSDHMAQQHNEAQQQTQQQRMQQHAVMR